MSRITTIKITREDGTEEVFLRGFEFWLLIVDNKLISLSGDERNNAFLLKMLEIAVVQDINRLHVIEEVAK